MLFVEDFNKNKNKNVYLLFVATWIHGIIESYELVVQSLLYYKFVWTCISSLVDKRWYVLQRQIHNTGILFLDVIVIIVAYIYCFVYV